MLKAQRLQVLVLGVCDPYTVSLVDIWSFLNNKVQFWEMSGATYNGITPSGAII